jgi:hypothetical protein
MVSIKNRIHEIIARSLSDKMERGEKFGTWDLAEEICDKLKNEKLEDYAIIAYLNKIICDLLAEEYGIIVDR